MKTSFLKRMHLFLLTACLLVPFSSQAASSVKSAQALLRRIAPAWTDKVVFEELKTADSDVFELDWRNGQLVVRGNSANSMAVGLNHYLKYYCNTSVSWYLADPVQLPSVAFIPRQR